MVKGKEKLLIPDYPIQVLPKLAEKIGLNEAIVLQQMHYWLLKSQKFADGCAWVYNTYENWRADNFPFWSVSTIGRIMRNLEKMGLVIAKKIDKKSYDQTKWYTINYQNDTLDGVKMASSSIPKRNDVKRNPETTTETTTETTFSPSEKSLTETQQWVSLLSEITGLNYNIKSNAGRLSRIGKQLRDAKYSLDEVKETFSPSGFWYVQDWRGQRSQRPTPEQILETVGKSAPVDNSTAGIWGALEKINREC